MFGKTLPKVLLSLFLAGPALAAERTVNLSVPGMTCPSCPYVVQAAIGEVDGVISVETDLDLSQATVTFDDDKATLDDIQFASASAGYEATPVPSDS